MPEEDVQLDQAEIKVTVTPEFSVPELPGDLEFTSYEEAMNVAAVTLGQGARFTIERVNVVTNVEALVGDTPPQVPEPPAYEHPIEDAAGQIDTSVPLTPEEVETVQQAADEAGVEWTPPEPVEPAADTPAPSQDAQPVDEPLTDEPPLGTEVEPTEDLPAEDPVADEATVVEAPISEVPDEVVADATADQGVTIGETPPVAPWPTTEPTVDTEAPAKDETADAAQTEVTPTDAPTADTSSETLPPADE